MERLDRIVGRLALPLVVAVLVVLPVAAFGYDRHINSQAPSGAKAFWIYFDGRQGWTERRVSGWNELFHRHPAPLKEITVRKGDLVVLRLMATDVHHGFALPAFGVGPVELVPGHYYEVRFRADRVGRFAMFCPLYCGLAHADMHGWLVVRP